jgi:CRISPR type IV-associated protein Csf2
MTKTSKTPKLDLVLRGTIVPITPIHITRPDAPKEDGGAPHLNVMLGNGITRVPYIPGESLKGMLRSRSADIASRASDQENSLKLFLSLYKGGIKGKEKENSDDVRRVVNFRESNPVLGLYGAAAPMWLGGSLSIQHAYPEDPDQAATHEGAGARLDNFKREPQRLEGIPEAMVEEYMDYVDSMRLRSDLRTQEKSFNPDISKLMKRKESGENVQAELDVFAEKKKAIKAQIAEVDAMETIGRPLDAIKAIAPGSKLSHTIRVIRGTDAEVGLLLETLRSVSDLCRIGGHRSTGYGFFKAEYSLLIREDEGSPYEAAGSVSISPEDFSLDSDHPLVERALEAWKSRVADPASLHVDVKA